MGQGAELKQGQRKGDFLAGKYLLEDCLGVGGMGEVYRATNVSLGRKVAIKLLAPEFVHIEEDVLRFLREARAAAGIRHPNVVDVIDVARDEDGTPFIVQELLAGEDLEQYLNARQGKLSCTEALEIMIPVADAVGAAHAQSVVHRDLKPANIYLSRERNKITPKVLDFGACLFPTLGERSAKEAKMLIGTPHYMAPEQIVSKLEVDARSDVWALGIILYELIVGETPFEGENLKAVLQAVKTRPVPSLLDFVKDAPLELDALVARCTKRDRLARYKDAGELHTDMMAVRQSMRDGVPMSRARPTISAEDESDLDKHPANDAARMGIRDVPTRDQVPITTTKLRGMKLLTLSSPTSEPPPSVDFGLEIKLPSDPSGRPPAPMETPALSAPPPGDFDSKPPATPRSTSHEGEPGYASSIPPVLDPRASRPDLGPPLAPSAPATFSDPPADNRFELMAPPRSEAKPPADRVSTPGPPPVAPTPRSAPISTRQPRPSFAGVASPIASAPPPPMSAEAGAKLGLAIALPAIVGLVVVLVVPAIGGPLGGALRGDSTFASGFMAVLALVSAAALGARTMLGEKKARSLYVASVGAVAFAIVMIIVTFAASEAAEAGLPASMGGLSTIFAPIAPLALAAYFGAHARANWTSKYARNEAIRSAVLASLLLFLALALCPVGAVRARGAGGSHPQKAETPEAPQQ